MPWIAYVCVYPFFKSSRIHLEKQVETRNCYDELTIRWNAGRVNADN
jgi:hypothetical protein